MNGGSITLDGNDQSQYTLRTGNHGSVQFLGNINVLGATESQIALFSHGQIFSVGTVVIGESDDNITGLRIEQSTLFLSTFFGVSSITIASNGGPGRGALTVQDGTIDTFDLSGGSGSTLLSVPNASNSEVEFSLGSNILLGPTNFAADQIRIVDNSNVNLDNALFPDSSSSTWNGKILLDRGSNLRLNFEDAPSTVSFTHTGDLKVGVNSNLEAFGVTDEPTTMTLGAGTGSTAQVVVGATAIFNAAKSAFEELSVLDGSLIFAGFARTTGTPELASAFNGLIIDFLDDADGTTDVATFTGDIATCSTGGIAYDTSGADACKPAVIP